VRLIGPNVDPPVWDCPAFGATTINSGPKTVVNSTSATVPKVSQIGLCGVVEADLELFYNSWSVGFLGERLYLMDSDCL